MFHGRQSGSRSSRRASESAASPAWSWGGKRGKVGKVEDLGEDFDWKI